VYGAKGLLVALVFGLEEWVLVQKVGTHFNYSCLTAGPTLLSFSLSPSLSLALSVSHAVFETELAAYLSQVFLCTALGQLRNISAASSSSSSSGTGTGTGSPEALLPATFLLLLLPTRQSLCDAAGDVVAVVVVAVVVVAAVAAGCRLPIRTKFHFV